MSHLLACTPRRSGGSDVWLGFICGRVQTAGSLQPQPSWARLNPTLWIKQDIDRFGSPQWPTSMRKLVACLPFKSASSILVFCLQRLVRCVQPLFTGHPKFSSGMMVFVSLDSRAMSEQGHCHILWQDNLPLHTQLQVGGALHGKSWVLGHHVGRKSPLKGSGGWAFTYCCSTICWIYSAGAETHYFSEWKMIHFCSAMFSAGSQSPSPTWWSDLSSLSAHCRHSESNEWHGCHQKAQNKCEIQEGAITHSLISKHTL